MHYIAGLIALSIEFAIIYARNFHNTLTEKIDDTCHPQAKHDEVLRTVSQAQAKRVLRKVQTARHVKLHDKWHAYIITHTMKHFTPHFCRVAALIFLPCQAQKVSPKRKYIPRTSGGHSRRYPGPKLRSGPSKSW